MLTSKNAGWAAKRIVELEDENDDLRDQLLVARREISRLVKHIRFVKGDRRVTRARSVEPAGDSDSRSVAAN